MSKYLLTFRRTIASVVTCVSLSSCSLIPQHENTRVEAEPSVGQEQTGVTAPAETPPCRYKRLMGIAHLNATDDRSTTFEFYPGDHIFSVKSDAVSWSSFEIGTEFKAIQLQLIDGPQHCERQNFEVGKPILKPES